MRFPRRIAIHEPQDLIVMNPFVGVQLRISNGKIKADCEEKARYGEQDFITPHWWKSIAVCGTGFQRLQKEATSDNAREKRQRDEQIQTKCEALLRIIALFSH